jgi:hypothetical protein
VPLRLKRVGQANVPLLALRAKTVLLVGLPVFNVAAKMTSSV